MRVLVATTAGAGHFGPLVPFARHVAAPVTRWWWPLPPSSPPNVERAGFPAWPLASVAVGEDERRAVFERVQSLPLDEANLLVISEVFGRIATGAMLGPMVDAVGQ